MKQLLPGKTITTVSYGTNDNGYPIVVVATAEGDIVTLTADGYTVDPEFIVTHKTVERAFRDEVEAIIAQIPPTRKDDLS